MTKGPFFRALPILLRVPLLFSTRCGPGRTAKLPCSLTESLYYGKDFGPRGGKRWRSDTTGTHHEEITTKSAP